MNEIFGYCGWDFGSAWNNEFQRGEDERDVQIKSAKVRMKK